MTAWKAEEIRSEWDAIRYLTQELNRERTRVNVLDDAVATLRNRYDKLLKDQRAQEERHLTNMDLIEERMGKLRATVERLEGRHGR